MILVTGASGYLGSQVVKRISDSKTAEVVATFNASNIITNTNSINKVHYEQCDVTSKSDIEKIFNRWNIEEVIHTAALLPDGKPDYLTRSIMSNVVGTANLAQAAAVKNCSKFIYCSTTSVYGASPSGLGGWKEEERFVATSEYALTKFSGEESLRVICERYGLNGISLRLSGIHGLPRRNGALYLLMKAAVRGETLFLKNGKNRFQFLLIEDAVESIVAALNSDMSVAYSVFNVASCTIDSLESLARKIIEIAGVDNNIKDDTDCVANEHIMCTDRMNEKLKFTRRDLEEYLKEMYRRVCSMESLYV